LGFDDEGFAVVGDDPSADFVLVEEEDEVLGEGGGGEREKWEEGEEKGEEGAGHGGIVWGEDGMGVGKGERKREGQTENGKGKTEKGKGIATVR